MTTETNTLLRQAQNVDEDQTADTGAFERRLIPTGPTLARFIGYVEIGKRTQKAFKGKAKADCEEVRFSFELVSPKNHFTIGEGDDTVDCRDIIGIRITKKMGDRSGFVKLLKKMSYGRPDRLNFGSMLGEAFLINIVHKPGKNNAGDDVIWANMKDENYNYLIGAPAQTDAISGKTTVFDVLPPINALRLLLWEHPTPEQWASIFIDGDRIVKVDGKDVTESKNWLQRDIITEALNFDGSPLHAMLSGLDTEATPIAGDKGDDKLSNAKMDDDGGPPMTTICPADQVTAPATLSKAVDGVAVGDMKSPAPAGNPDVTEINPPPVGEPNTEAKNEAQLLFDQLGV